MGLLRVMELVLRKYGHHEDDKARHRQGQNRGTHGLRCNAQVTWQAKSQQTNLTPLPFHSPIFDSVFAFLLQSR